MKNLGSIVLVAVVSSLLSVGVYDWIKGDPTEIVRIEERTPARYANYQSGTFSDVDISKPDRTLNFTAAPTDFIDAAEMVTNAVVNIKALAGSKRSKNNDVWGSLNPGISMSMELELR